MYTKWVSLINPIFTSDPGLKAQCNVDTIGKLHVDLITAGAVDPVGITHMVRGGVDGFIIGQKWQNNKPFLEYYHFA